MTKWPIADGVLLFCEGEYIKALPEGLPSDLHLSAPVLYEWIEYWLEAEALEVYFGAEMVHPVHSDLFRYTYCNQIGQSTIRLRMADGRMIRRNVEVISRKLKVDPRYKGDPLFYPVFYRRLVDGLAEHQHTLPFTFVAPTYHIVEEIPEPPSLLFLFHFLRDVQVREKLKQAIEAILARPHRLLTAEEEFVPFHRVHEVDADVVLSILASPQHWVEYQGTRLAVAERLGGYAPQKVWQRLAVETFDTSENRFVKWFVGELLGWVEKLRAWKQFPGSADDEFVELKGQLEMALHDPLFDEVGDMVYFPATSQVLLKRSGYRELLELYRQYLNSKRPAFFRDLQEAIDSRDVATLYEYWCFFELVRRLEEDLGWGEPKLKLVVREGGELAWDVTAEFGSGHKLVYNEGFGRGRGRSYSVALRPDFVLHEGGKATVVFDAKFRFDVRSLPKEQEDHYDEDVASGDVEQVVKHADLYKMHTYRDALKTVRVAVVLFPGTEDKGEFYDRSTSEKRTLMGVKELVEGKWEGVGAIPLLPGS